MPETFSADPLIFVLRPEDAHGSVPENYRRKGCSALVDLSSTTADSAITWLEREANRESIEHIKMAPSHLSHHRFSQVLEHFGEIRIWVELHPWLNDHLCETCLERLTSLGQGVEACVVLGDFHLIERVTVGG